MTKASLLVKFKEIWPLNINFFHAIFQKKKNSTTIL